MNLKYKKSENENEYEYGLRLIEIKIQTNPEDLDWQDVVDLLGLNVHYDSLRKAANVTPYSGYNVMQYFKKKYEKQAVNDGSGYLDELEQKTLEFNRARQKYFDQRREYNKTQAVLARQEALNEHLTRIANQLNEERPLELNKYYSDYSECDAVVVLADWHYGMKTDNIWQTYNIEICRKRIEKFVTSSKSQLKLHKPERLHIILLGDLAHGQFTPVLESLLRNLYVNR